MILVDVYVMILDKKYDFELDENTPVGELVKKIVLLVAGQEGVKAEHTDEMFLYAEGIGRILNKSVTLNQQGIRTGSELLLC